MSQRGKEAGKPPPRMWLSPLPAGVLYDCCHIYYIHFFLFFLTFLLFSSVLGPCSALPIGQVSNFKQTNKTLKGSEMRMIEPQ